MRKLFAILFMCSAASVFAQPMPQGHPAVPAATPTAAPTDPNKVILQVGKEKMTAAEYEAFISSLPPQVQQMASGPGRRVLAEKIVDVKILAGEARKQGIDKNPKVAIALQMAQEQILAQSMAEKIAAEGDEATLKAQFEKDKAKYEQVKARHILIRFAGSPAPAGAGKKDLTDAEAKAKIDEIRDKIVNKKADFAELAKAESDDRGSAERSGDLGTFSRGQMVGPFEESAFSLKDGEVSQPIKTAFGYHLIQVQEHITPTFEQVKAQLSAQQGGQKVDELVKQLRPGQKVMLDDDFFGAASQKPAGHP